MRGCWAVGAAILALVLSPAASQADDQPDLANQALHTGGKALEFTVNKNVFLTPRLGTALSYKSIRSGHSGWRVGLEAVFNDEHDSTTMSTFSADSTRHQEADVARRAINQSYAVSFECLRFFEPNSRVVGYFATGPRLAYGHASATEVRSDVTVDQGNNMWGAGWTAALGAEFFVFKNISLESQYGLAASYTRVNLTNTNSFSSGSQTNHTHTSVWNVSPTGVSLGLSMYFR